MQAIVSTCKSVRASKDFKIRDGKVLSALHNKLFTTRQAFSFQTHEYVLKVLLHLKNKSGKKISFQMFVAKAHVCATREVLVKVRKSVRMFLTSIYLFFKIIIIHFYLH